MGFTIIINPNAYMTDGVWVLVTHMIMKGYRLMLFVKQNPQWMVLELLDGFVTHELVLEAHEKRYRFLV